MPQLSPDTENLTGANGQDLDLQLRITSFIDNLRARVEELEADSPKNAAMDKANKGPGVRQQMIAKRKKQIKDAEASLK